MVHERPLDFKMVDMFANTTTDTHTDVILSIFMYHVCVCGEYFESIYNEHTKLWYCTELVLPSCALFGSSLVLTWGSGRLSV